MEITQPFALHFLLEQFISDKIGSTPEKSFGSFDQVLRKCEHAGANKLAKYLKTGYDLFNNNNLPYSYDATRLDLIKKVVAKITLPKHPYIIPGG